MRSRAGKTGTFVLSQAPLHNHFRFNRLNRTGVSGDLSVCELSGLLGSEVSVVSGFHLGWRHVAAVLVEAAVVEPVDPLGGRDLDLLNTALWGLVS